MRLNPKPPRDSALLFLAAAFTAAFLVIPAKAAEVQLFDGGSETSGLSVKTEYRRLSKSI